MFRLCPQSSYNGLQRGYHDLQNGANGKNYAKYRQLFSVKQCFVFVVVVLFFSSENEPFGLSIAFSKKKKDTSSFLVLAC